MHISFFKTRYVGNKCLLIYYSSTFNYFKFNAVCNPILSTNSQYFLCGWHVLLDTLKMTHLGHSPFCLLDYLREIPLHKPVSSVADKLQDAGKFSHTVRNHTTSTKASWKRVTWMLRTHQCLQIRTRQDFCKKHRQIVPPPIQRGRSLASGNKFLTNTANQMLHTAYTLRHASWQTKQHTIAFMSTSHCASNTHSVTWPSTDAKIP